MIRYRNGAYEIVVNIGKDPVTGRERRVSRSIRMPEQRRIPRAVLDVEAHLRLQAKAGEIGGPNITVGELLDLWMLHIGPDKSPTTLHGYERCIRLLLKPDLGAVRLDALKTAQIDALYARLRAAGGRNGTPLAPATVRQAHAVLRRALEQAVIWEWIPANPAARATAPKVPAKAITATVSIVELEQLIATANEDLGFLIALAASTGARRGELCGIRWADVDLDRGVLTLAQSVVEIEHQVIHKGLKHGTLRRVKLGPNTVMRLRERRALQEARAAAAGVPLAPVAYVCSDDLDAARPLHPNLASDRFRTHARRQGIDVRLHDLRHAKASHAMAAGLAANDVAASLGHTSAKMTLDVYGHAMIDGLERVSGVLDLPVGNR